MPPNGISQHFTSNMVYSAGLSYAGVDYTKDFNKDFIKGFTEDFTNDFVVRLF